jgi:hypothetical protein
MWSRSRTGATLIRAPRGRLVPVAIAAITVVCVVAGLPLAAAVAAPADATTPNGADDLARQIKEQFAVEMDVDVPPYRTRIAGWEIHGASYLVDVEVFDILFGLSPKRALVLAACWDRNGGFSGGWADTAEAEADLRAEFETAAASCPTSP